MPDPDPDPTPLGEIEKSSNDASKTPKTSNAILARSARGASFLILLQIGSRALTFIVNQILLRYLSPELLGISAQLELYTISVLYFARDSLRVALQRQRSASGEVEQDHLKGPETSKGKLAASESEEQRRRSAQELQEVVNLSTVSFGLGIPLAFALAALYVRNAEPQVLKTPHFRQAVNLYRWATLVELLAEPCFAVSSRQMLYSTRAAAEASATLTRCIVTCGTAMWLSLRAQDAGALPFAIGQMSYAVVLWTVYYIKIHPVSKGEGFSLHLVPMNPSSPQKYILSRFSRPLISLSLNLYAQSGLKHILTQGDSILIASLATLTDQGTYALASNYGSLLARMLFQPIEESSRGVFGRLLAPYAPPSHNPSREGVHAARDYLLTVLRLYSLLSVIIMSLGPTLAPLLLRYIAGSRWSSTEAGSVLSVYCYYIPLLAINGILEAFVSAVATSGQLRVQSLWMFAFSAGFAGAGFILLRVYESGAKGLVFANAVNMLMRICWSWWFVSGFLKKAGADIGVRKVLPSVATRLVGILVAIYLNMLRKGFDGGLGDLVKCVTTGGVYGLMLLYFERTFLFQCYQMLRPPSPPKASITKKQI